MLIGDPIKRHKANIVPMVRIVRTGIAEADNELHRGHPRSSGSQALGIGSRVKATINWQYLTAALITSSQQALQLPWRQERQPYHRQPEPRPYHRQHPQQPWHRRQQPIRQQLQHQLLA
jgi:hypothetical protein